MTTTVLSPQEPILLLEGQFPGKMGGLLVASEEAFVPAVADVPAEGAAPAEVAVPAEAVARDGGFAVGGDHVAHGACCCLRKLRRCR